MLKEVKYINSNTSTSSNMKTSM